MDRYHVSMFELQLLRKHFDMSYLHLFGQICAPQKGTEIGRNTFTLHSVGVSTQNI